VFTPFVVLAAHIYRPLEGQILLRQRDVGLVHEILGLGWIPIIQLRTDFFYERCLDLLDLSFGENSLAV
jgi:hypothetical protein